MKPTRILLAALGLSIGAVLLPAPALGQLCLKCERCFAQSKHKAIEWVSVIGYYSAHEICLSGVWCDPGHPSCSLGFNTSEEETIIDTVLKGTINDIALVVDQHENVIYDSELDAVLILGCNDAVRAWIPLRSELRGSVALATGGR